jgi:hypothetical protein
LIYGQFVFLSAFRWTTERISVCNNITKHKSNFFSYLGFRQHANRLLRVGQKMFSSLVTVQLWPDVQHGVLRYRGWTEAQSTAMQIQASVPGRTYNFQLWFLTSAKYFQSAAVVGGRNSNIPADAKPWTLYAIAASPSLLGQTHKISTAVH